MEYGNKQIKFKKEIIMKTKLTLIIAVLFTSMSIYGQTLNCNANLNTSLDLEGFVPLTVDMMHEGPVDPGFDSVLVIPSFLDCSNIGLANEVHVIGWDSNGNTIAECWGIVLVDDFTKPVAVVEVDATVTLDENGMYAIQVEDIDEGSYDNCSIVLYEFSPAILDCESANPTAVTLTITDQSGNTNQAITNVWHDGIDVSASLVCNDITSINVIVGPVTLTLDMFLVSGASACPSDYAMVFEDANGTQEVDFVLDASDVGNTFNLTVLDWVTEESCTSTFTVISAGEPYGICVFDFEGNPVVDVEVALDKVTDETGCVSIDGTSGLVITGAKDDEVANGVDDIDLLLIREHILGMISLEGEQLLAADLSGDNGVTTLDLVLMGKALLENYLDEIWKFVDGEFEFETDVTPVNYNQYITLGAGGNYDFVGIKMGDLDLSYDELVSDDDKNTLVIEDIALNAGETYLVDVKMSEDAALVVASIFFPAQTSEYEVLSISSPISTYVFEAATAIEGDLANFRWLGLEEAEFGGVSFAEGDVLFTIEIKALENGVLNHTFEFAQDSKNSKWKKSAELTGEHLKADIQNKIGVPTVDTELEKINIYPNPATENIYVEAAGLDINEARFTMMDLSGKIVKSGFIATNSTIEISELNQGMYLLELTQENKTWSPQIVIKK